MADTKTVPQQEEEELVVQTTVRMPHALNVRAKIAVAPLHGFSLNQLFLEGLEMRLKQLEAGQIETTEGVSA